MSHLSRRRLSVGEDGAVEAANRLHDDRLRKFVKKFESAATLIVNVILWGWSEHGATKKIETKQSTEKKKIRCCRRRDFFFSWSVARTHGRLRCAFEWKRNFSFFFLLSVLSAAFVCTLSWSRLRGTFI